MTSPYTFDRVVRLIITAMIIATALYLLDLLRQVLTPFFIAILLAYLLNPVVDFVQYKLKFKNRIFSVISTLFVIGSIVSLVIYFLIPSLVKEMHRAIKLMNEYYHSIHFEKYIPEDVMDKLNSYGKLENLKELLNAENFQKISSNTVTAIKYVFSSATEIMWLLVSIFAILLYLIFILIDYNRITESWKSLIPHNYKKQTLQLAKDLEDGMNSYFRAQAKIVFWVSLLFIIGFKTIGLPMALTLGIFIGLLNFVPYLQLVGFIPAFIVASLYCADTGQKLLPMFGLIILVFSIVQIIQEVLLTPKIMGDLTGLNPAIIMLSLSIWGALLGILGMIIALPLTTVILSYYKRFLKKQKDEYMAQDSLE